jgi:hypothetical protein
VKERDHLSGGQIRDHDMIKRWEERKQKQTYIPSFQQKTISMMAMTTMMTTTMVLADIYIYVDFQTTAF